MKKSSLISWLGMAIMVLALISGCGGPEKRFNQAAEKFGPAMDAARKDLGILPIPANAGASLADETTLAWMSGDAEACHMVKRLVFDKGISVPISETDQVRCPDGMMTVETTYSADGKSVSKQVFKINRQEMPAEKAKGILKEVMAKDATRVIAPPPVEDVNRNK